MGVEKWLVIQNAVVKRERRLDQTVDEVGQMGRINGAAS